MISIPSFTSARFRAAALSAALLAACALPSASAFAQTPPPPPTPTPTPVPTPTAEEEAARAKDMGLPAATGLAWRFNFDASIGFFGFHNSLYTNPHPDQPSGNLSDNWLEGAVKPALSATYTSQSKWQLYAKASAVGERNFSTPPTVVGETASSFRPEDLNLGWRSGTSMSLGENVLDFTVGRAQYTLGHGLILWDGAAEGGSRGGYWTNARKAYKFAGIGRFKPGNNTLEGFYLEKDELPEATSHSRLWGVNYQYAFNENNTLGATYLKWHADSDVKPQRDGMNVYNLRAFIAPFKDVPLSFEAEGVREDNGDAFRSYGWYAQGAWEFSLPWKPKLSYRYAAFDGDDPATTRNESFDPLFTGFYDWGSWWQGEIAGEYFISNSNLISHQVRVHTAPSESIGAGIIFWDFLLKHPEALGPNVTSSHVAGELDLYMDWKWNSHFTLSVVGAFADPGKAVEQAFGRTKTFTYGMLFLAYSY